MCCLKSKTLTVKPFRVVLERPLEAELLPAGGQIVQVRSENDGIRLGEFRVGSGIQTRKIPGVAPFHPNRCRVVGRIVRALGNSHTYARHEGTAAQVCQIGLQEEYNMEAVLVHRLITLPFVYKMPFTMCKFPGRFSKCRYSPRWRINLERGAQSVAARDDTQEVQSGYNGVYDTFLEKYVCEAKGMLMLIPKYFYRLWSFNH